MEKYCSDAAMIGMKEIILMPIDIPSCMIITKEFLIRGMEEVMTIMTGK